MVTKLGFQLQFRNVSMCKLDLKLNLFSIYLKILHQCFSFNIEINTIAFPKSELDEKLGDISQSTQRKY